MASKKRGRKSVADIKNDFAGNPVAEADYIVKRIKKLKERYPTALAEINPMR